MGVLPWETSDMPGDIDWSTALKYDPKPKSPRSQPPDASVGLHQDKLWTDPSGGWSVA